MRGKDAGAPGKLHRRSEVSRRIAANGPRADGMTLSGVPTGAGLLMDRTLEKPGAAGCRRGKRRKASISQAKGQSGTTDAGEFYSPRH